MKRNRQRVHDHRFSPLYQLFETLNLGDVGFLRAAGYLAEPERLVHFLFKDFTLF